MHSDEKNSEHLGGEAMAGYLDGRLSTVEKARVEDHLEECDECRRELIAVGRLIAPVEPAPAPAPAVPARWRRRSVLSALAVAAAAGLALVLLRLPPGEGTPSPLVRVEDAAATEGVPMLDVVQPATGASFGVQDRALVWRSAGPDALYQVTVADAIGRILWSGTTTDTATVVPGEVTIESGVRHFWRVDALLPNGVSATTRVHSFIGER